MSSDIKQRPYVTGFCGTGGHTRCPGVIDQGKHRFISCTCSCHAGQNIAAMMEAPIGIPVVPSRSNGDAPVALNGAPVSNGHSPIPLEALRRTLAGLLVR